MGIDETIEIAASADTVWAAWIDVATWPNWSDSVSSAERLDTGALSVGSRSRLVQPGLRPAVWTVTELIAPVDGQAGSFTWVSRAPGIRTTASHIVVATAPTSCRVTLRVEQDGFLAGVVDRILGARTRRLVAMEAAGVRTVSESRA
jgi:uncharacterized membrane protein